MCEKLLKVLKGTFMRKKKKFENVFTIVSSDNQLNSPNIISLLFLSFFADKTRNINDLIGLLKHLHLAITH